MTQLARSDMIERLYFRTYALQFLRADGDADFEIFADKKRKNVGLTHFSTVSAGQGREDPVTGDAPPTVGCVSPIFHNRYGISRTSTSTGLDLLGSFIVGWRYACVFCPEHRLLGARKLSWKLPTPQSQVLYLLAGGAAEWGKTKR